MALDAASRHSSELFALSDVVGHGVGASGVCRCGLHLASSSEVGATSRRVTRLLGSLGAAARSLIRRSGP